MNGQDYEQLTLFPEDSPASRSPLPGSDGARKMTATSGRKWLGLSRNSGPLGLLEKMLLESSEWHSPIFYLNWKPVGIGRGHFLFQLALSEPATGDTGWQSWPTPDTMCYRDGGTKRKEAKGRHAMSLNHAVAAEQETAAMWPTPRGKESGDYQYSRGDHGKKTPTLSGAVKLFPTPTAQDAKNSTLPASQIKRGSLVGDVMREMFATPKARDYRTGQASRWERSRNLNDQIVMYPTPTGARICGGTHAKEHLEKMVEAGSISETEKKSMQNGNGGQLNPNWVEWLMGLPVGWTEI